MTHTFHDRLEGFDARQILHDGCRECVERGADLRSAFAHMDEETFEKAWRRAFDINASAGSHDVGRESHAEANLLMVLFNIQLVLHRRGFPLDGNLPSMRERQPIFDFPLDRREFDDRGEGQF